MVEDISTKSTNSIPDLSPIQDFYSNTNIFITGGTGFYGKVLIEKLLRSCPTVSKIYILIRNKKGIDSKSRFMEVFDDILFERLKKESPNIFNKVDIIYGDLLSPDLGISLASKQLLMDKINIIFHIGATVNFNEKLRKAIFTNCRSTRDLVHLARQMPNLKAMMYISTAYANVIHDVTEEKIYSPLFDSHTLICVAENLPESTIEKIKYIFIQDYPNAYTFSKHIAEAIILEHGSGLPIGIQRPAIVASTYKEPIKSWVNGINGIAMYALNVCLGLLRTIQMDARIKANIVPVDMCINSLIASALDVAVIFQRTKMERNPFEIPVYNYESSNDKPIEWGYLTHKIQEYTFNYPSVKIKWYPSITMTRYYTIDRLLRFFLHTLPAILFDVVGLLCGEKSFKMLKINSKINKFCDNVSCATVKKLTFKSNNVRRLISEMSDKDKNIFFFDLKELDWDDFLQNYMYGLRLYLLKETVETLTEAKTKLKRLYWAHQFTKLVVEIVLLGIIWFLVLPFFTLAYKKIMTN